MNNSIENLNSLKVLVISYDFYPYDTPNSHRWNSVLKEWSRKGIQVFVISASRNNSLKFENYEGIKIFRTEELFFKKLKSRFKNEHNKTGLKKPNNFKWVIKLMIRRLYDLFWANLYWPDFAFLWFFPAKKKALEIIENNNIDNLITVSWPFTDHLIGYALKKYKKKLNWLADTIDPFSFIDGINNKYIYKKLNIFYERKIYNSANYVTVLTQKIKEEYIKLYPELYNKITVNHNLYVPKNAIINNNPKPSTSTIKLVYVGALIDKVRTPENLLLIFSILTKNLQEFDFELHFYGDLNNTNKYFEKYSNLLNHSIYLHGKIERNDVPFAIESADILVNIGNNNLYQEPSKVIEYIFSGKKIINICTLENDTSAQLLKNYPLHMNINMNKLCIDEIHKQFLNFLQTSHKFNADVTKDFVKKYCLSAIETHYFELMFKENTLQ